MNKVIEMGRLVRDPESRNTGGSNPTAVAQFTIAVDRRYKKDGQQEADFFPCVTFGKQAEFAEKYLKQGVKVVLTGRLQNDVWTDKDGNKKTTAKIYVEELEFAESKKANDDQPQAGTKAKKADDGFVTVPQGIDDELPFSF